jgi:hypothetical protein
MTIRSRKQDKTKQNAKNGERTGLALPPDDYLAPSFYTIYVLGLMLVEEERIGAARNRKQRGQEMKMTDREGRERYARKRHETRMESGMHE